MICSQICCTTPGAPVKTTLHNVFLTPTRTTFDQQQRDGNQITSRGTEHSRATYNETLCFIHQLR